MHEQDDKTFTFDHTRSADENIRLFLTYLKSVDAELGALLDENLDALLDGMNTDKVSARREFAKKVVTKLTGFPDSRETLP